MHSIENDQNKTSIPAFWARAYADGTMDTLLAQSDNQDYIFGVCYGNPNKNEKTFEYSIAVKCDKDTPVPSGFRKNLVPARTWAVFSCVGAMPNAIQETWQKIVTEFFPTAEYQPTNEMDIEAYTQGDMDAPDYRSEIWVPIVKK